MRRSAYGWLVGAMLLAGCTEDVAPPPPGPSAPTVTLETLRDEVLGAICGVVVGCEAALGRFFNDSASCVEFFGLFFAAENNTGIFSNEDLRNLYTFDADKAAACIAKIEAVNTCDLESFTFTDTDPDCQGTLVGTLVEDDCCDPRGGCGTGLECERVNRGDTGVCQPPGAVDESCWTRQCAAGLACDNSTSPPLCKTEKSVSQTCNFTDEPCGPGMYCDLAAMGGPACVVTMEGSRCSRTRDCPNEDEYDCFFNGMASTCRRSKQANDACTAMDRCIGEYACINGTCQQPALGAECNPNDDNCPVIVEIGGCLPEGTMFICKAPGGSGDDCDENNQMLPDCAWGQNLYCNPVSNMCEAMPGANDPCTGLCQPLRDMYCDDSGMAAVCRPRVAGGSSCNPASSDILGGCELGFACDGMTSRCEPAIDKCI